jgi:uncharacterized protein YydD (DUF2326 family)
MSDPLKVQPETVRCQLYNVQHNEYISRVEIDLDLLNPEAGLVNPDNMSLDSLHGGAIYTLVPLEDHTIKTLQYVKEVHTRCRAPLDSFSAAFGRMDELMNAVDTLFGEIEYRRITDPKQLEFLIQPSTKNEEFEPPKVVYNILGDLLAQALTKGNEEHEHSESCTHW